MTPSHFREQPWPLRHARRAALIAGLALAACSPPPDLPGRAAPVTGPAPVLVPLDGILAQADAPGPDAAATAEVDARAAALRARAAGLRRQ